MCSDESDKCPLFFIVELNIWHFWLYRTKFLGTVLNPRVFPNIPEVYFLQLFVSFTQNIEQIYKKFSYIELLMGFYNKG